MMGAFCYAISAIAFGLMLDQQDTSIAAELSMVYQRRYHHSGVGMV